MAGLIAGNALHELGAIVWGINVDDDDAQVFNVKIRGDLRKWKERYGQGLDVEGLPIHIIDGYLGPGYGRTYPAMLDTIRLAARTEGIVLDPVYSGKAFHGMLTEIEGGRLKGSKNIVFIHTGGIFGLFAQRSDFEFGNGKEHD